MSRQLNHAVRRSLATLKQATQRGALKALLNLVRARRWALRVLRSIVHPIASDTDWCADLPFPTPIPCSFVPFALLPATCASSRQQPISNAGPLTKREAASATPWKLKGTANMQARFNAAIGWDAIVAQGANLRSAL